MTQLNERPWLVCQINKFGMVKVNDDATDGDLDDTTDGDMGDTGDDKYLLDALSVMFRKEMINISMSDFVLY